MCKIVESDVSFLWMPNQLPMFLQSSDAIQYSLDASKVLEARKVEDRVPVFRESIKVRSAESSALGFPAKKLMADAKGYKTSPKITTDSTLNDLVIGVPWDTAAGSRDPDPHPKEPGKAPAPAQGTVSYLYISSSNYSEGSQIETGGREAAAVPDGRISVWRAETSQGGRDDRALNVAFPQKPDVLHLSSEQNVQETRREG